jgi:hypothetical protein
VAYKHVFGIDPGEVNNGFVYIKYDTETKTGDTKIMEILTVDKLHEMLHLVWGIRQASPEAEMHFAVENFRVNSNQDVRKKTFFWDEVKTIRIIGAIDLAAKWSNAKITLQEPKDVLPMARKWSAGHFKMAQHPRDDQSAWCHAVHFMMKRQWITVADQITMKGQERLL